GMFLGMMPLFSLYSILVLLLIFLININISAAILGFFVFQIFSYAFDPLFHDLGYFLLVDTEWLFGFWTALYNLPVMPLTRFNNTVVLGSLVSSLIITIPVFYSFRFGIIKYRSTLEPKIRKMKLVQLVRSNKAFQMYMKITGMEE
ncbi:TIGR03546 family protein, partial [candidate division KSB1 bacterium]